MSALNSTVLNFVSGEDNQLAAGVVGLVAILVAVTVYYTSSLKDKRKEFPKLPGLQLYHAWDFFRRRYDFLWLNLKQNPGGFSFSILQHNVVALAGEDARQAFFSHPHLDLGEGYKIFMGAVPLVSNVEIATEENEEGKPSLFNKKLNKILNKSRIQAVLPTLLQDIIHTADGWGESSRIDPFTDIYDLVFLMTTRMTSCHEITDNKADLKRIQELFSILQVGATPVALLLPWFPSPSRRSVKKNTTELYTLFRRYVEARRDAEPTSDAIDVLIAAGETTQNIIGFIMATLFAGVANTGIISCWMLINLAANPEWREKCKKEVQELLSRYSSPSSGTLHQRLGTIPVSAWEDEIPILDACIRESQRIAVTGTTLRRNIHEELKIAGRVVKRGDFLAYSIGDVHLNPEYYPEPHKYDPSRWLDPASSPDAIYSYLGWGAGRHPCAGMKVAKLEMKMILVMFLARYDYELVDKNGKFPNPLPVPNRNDIHQARPLGPKCYLDVKKIVE